MPSWSTGTLSRNSPASDFTGQRARVWTPPEASTALMAAPGGVRLREVLPAAAGARLRVGSQAGPCAADPSLGAPRRAWPGGEIWRPERESRACEPHARELAHRREDEYAMGRVLTASGSRCRIPDLAAASSARRGEAEEVGDLVP